MTTMVIINQEDNDGNNDDDDRDDDDGTNSLFCVSFCLFFYLLCRYRDIEVNRRDIHTKTERQKEGEININYIIKS